MLVKIFINYHHENLMAVPIYRELKLEFGEDNVFFDTSIAPGKDFEEKIKTEIKKCDVFLSLIGPNWLNNFKEKMDSEQPDLAREEIIIALKRSANLTIIPIITEGAKIPPSKLVPEDIRNILKLQAYYISRQHFDRDIKDLIQKIKDGRGKALGATNASGASGLISGIRSLALTEMFYFDEITRMWERDSGICVSLAAEGTRAASGAVRVFSARSPEFLCVANLPNGTCIEYWKISSRRSAVLDPPRAFVAETSKGEIYTIQCARIQRGELFFDDAQYFIDNISSVRARRHGRRHWNAWNTVIEVAGREHVVLMGLHPNSANAAGDVIAEHKVMMGALGFSGRP